MATGRSTVPTLCLAVLAGGPCMTHAAQSSIVTEDHMIESADPGIRLFVRNKHPAGMTQYRSGKAVLFGHGGNQAGSSTIRPQNDEESWMGLHARHGYD